jgi:excinuclease ABC subunit B
MKRTIDQTNYRREKQLAYNISNNITPKAIVKSKESILGQTKVADSHFNFEKAAKAYEEKLELNVAADPVLQYMNKEQLSKAILALKKQMEKAAKELDFIEAAWLRDEMFAMEKMFDSKK